MKTVGVILLHGLVTAAVCLATIAVVRAAGAAEVDWAVGGVIAGAAAVGAMAWAAWTRRPGSSRRSTL